MTITFYTNTYDRRVVDKSAMSPYSQIGTVSGTLRRETDVRRPVIQFALSDTYINDPSLNYAYIAEWGKYYYITDKKVLRDGFVEFSLQEDVLMTFRMEILASDALIERWEQNESPYLSDAQRPITASIAREIIEKAGTIPDHFNPENVTDQNAKPYALTLVGSITQTWMTPTTGDIWKPNLDYPLNLVGPKKVTYAMTNGEVTSVLDYLIGGSISSSFYGQGTEGVIGCVVFPFDLSAVGAADGQQNPVNMFSHQVSNYTAQSVYPNATLRFSFGKFKSTRANASFADLEPYRRATLYLPYIGMVDIPMRYIGGNGIQIEYNVDPRTGACQAMVYALDANDQIVAMIKALAGQLGVQIPITSSNAVQMTQVETMAAIKMAIGAATSFANPAAGIAQIAGAVSTAAMNPLTMSGQMPNSDLAIRARSSPYILIDSQVDETPSGYGHFVGYPSGKVHQLGSMADSTLGPRLVKVQEIFWAGGDTATLPEQDEIFSLLKAGVLI